VNSGKLKQYKLYINMRAKHYYNTLNGFDDTFRVVFLADLSNFWLLVLTADKEQEASEDVSTPDPFPALCGNVYCKSK
jgi:hypothetical protein